MLQLIKRFFQAIINFFKRLFGRSPKPVPTPALSSVRIVSPAAPVSGPLVTIEYDIVNTNSDPTDIAIKFSVAGGVAQSMTALVTHPQHEGTAQLSSSPQGERHRFVWDWQKDITANPVNNVVLQIFPTTAKGAGAVAFSAPVTISVPIGPSNQRPRIRVQVPTGVLLIGQYIEVDYQLFDDESDVLHIEVEYSVNNGATFQVATESNHPASEGTSSLASSPAGVAHKFIWNAASDLPAIPATDVLLRVQSYDALKGGSDTTTPFTVGHAGSNHPPAIRLHSPMTNTDQGAIVGVTYDLLDDNSDPVRIEVSYSIDGGLTFRTATEASGFGSEGITNLTSSPAGMPHVFFWKAVNDLAALPATNIILQMQAFDSAPGAVVSAGPFTVTDNHPPLIQIFSPQAGSQQAAPIAIQYVLTDRESDACSLEASYSLDNGQTFLPATPHNTGDGVNNLVSSPTGVNKVLVWDAEKDLSTLTQSNVMFRIKVKDKNPGGMSVSSLFDVAMPIAPSINILQPTAGVWGDPVPIVYQLSHPAGSQALSAEIEYSVDNGATYAPASEALSVNSEGLLNLTADTHPITHFFAWDALKDIANLDQAPKDNVLVRIRSTKNALTGEDVTDLFTIDSGFVGVPEYAAPSAGVKRPVIEQVFTPPNHQGIHVAARFLLKHEDNARANIRAQFSVNGGDYRNATPAFYSDQLTNLAAPKINTQYRFIWDAAADMRKLGLLSGQVRLKLTPYIGPWEGVGTETNTFSFTIKTPAPIPSAIPKSPLSALRIVKLQGDNQHILAGQLPPDSLVVEVRDGNNQAIQGARLTFSLEKTSPVTANFEEDPNLRTITDYYGRAAIRVRPQQGVGGKFKVLVTVAGVPGVSEVFNLESHVPVIQPLQNNPTGPFMYGEKYSFYFHLDIGQPLYGRQLTVDSHDPITIRVEPLNAEASVKYVTIPGPSVIYQDNTIFQVDITPSSTGGTSLTTQTFNLKLEALNLQGVQPLNITNQFIVTPFNATHLKGMNIANNGFGPASEVFDDLRLYLKVISGHGAPDPNNPGQLLPQKAFPGGTLSTPFQVEVSDGTSTPYLFSTDRTYIDCTQTVTKSNLKIQWTAVGGVLSTSPNKGTLVRLEAPPNEKVYFTATGPAPWAVMANFNGNVWDENAQPINYFIKRNTTNSAGNPVVVSDPYCIYKPGLAVNISRVFFIQLPEAIGLEDISKATASAHGPLLKQVKSGLPVKILVQGVSPLTSGSVLEPMKMESLLSTGLPVAPYTGTTLTFKQDIPLSVQTNGDIQSGTIVLIQNENKTSAGIGHAMLPLSQVKASVHNVMIAVKTAGRKRKRLRFGDGSLDGDTEFTFESPVATSPTGGLAQSITLHNGEFMLNRCDLNFPSRVKDISVCRTYRSQLKSVVDPDNEYDVPEPFGPGWILDAGIYLEVAHKHLRYWDDHGVCFDFPYQYPGKGQFVFMTVNRDITADQSAYEMRDRHGNVYHFNIDGTLRFIKDRFKNRYDYEYNEKAQLVKIKDCMQPGKRAITITWHDDTKANREKYLAGKVMQIEDFDTRKTRYEYYEKAPAGSTQVGAPGFLKKVTFPECETVMEGSTATVMFSSYEKFEYEQNTRAGWILKSVTALDSKGAEQVRLVNEYNADARIIKQTDGPGEYTVQYALDPVTKNTFVDYKNKNDFITKFVFPPSAYWDSAAPIELKDPENHVTSLKYNYDGHLTYIKPPMGGYTEYVYDEDSQFARHRADLLAEIKTSDTGEKRIHTSTYSSRYHFPLLVVRPEGNLQGVDPELFVTVSNYDHQRGTGDAGNIVDTYGPRTMNIVNVPVNTTDRRPTWIEENPKQEYAYNSFGQVTTHIDERGVKTEYDYYAADSPTEGTISATGGGLLAQVRFDTEVNAKRTLHLPGDDAIPQVKKITYAYTGLGHVKEITDQYNTKTKHTLNKLGKVIKTESGDGIAGLHATQENHIGPGGEIVRHKEIKHGTDGFELVVDYEFFADGLMKSKSTKMNGALLGTETFLYDKGDRIVTTTDSQSGAQTSHEYDKRDLETKTTVISGVLNLVTERKYTAHGSLKETKEPSGDITTMAQNGFGETIKVTDPAGITTETVLNDAGVPVVSLKKNPAGKIIACKEIVVDEYTRVRRCYDLRFNSNTTTSSTRSRYRKIPENLGISNGQYLASLGEALMDSGFGPGDGRTTTDFVWSVSGEMIQLKNDGLQQLMTRQDALGRTLEKENREAARVNMSYNDATREIESTTTARTDTTPPEAHEFKTTQKFDDAGRLETETDEHNRVSTFKYDEVMLSGIVNAENTEVTFKYDGLKNLEEVQTALTVMGQSTDPELQNSIAQYNPGKTIRRQTKLDSHGRLVSSKNMAGHEYQYVYKDNLLSEIIYPAAKSTGNQGAKESFVYNKSNGRLESYTDASGLLTTYSYDKDRLTQVTIGQKMLSVKYTDQGYLEEIEDASNAGGKVTYKYDSVGNVISKTEMDNGQLRTTEFQYDGVGRLSKTIYGAGDFLENIYDEKSGLLKEVRDQQGTMVSYRYFGDSIKTEERSGLVTTYFYSNGHLTGREVVGASAGNIRTTCRFDIMDRLIEKTEVFAGNTTTQRFDYDSAGRILKEELTLSSVPQPLLIRYYYDGDNNIRKFERDELDITNGDIIRVTREQEFDERGVIVAFTETRQSVLLPVVVP